MQNIATVFGSIPALDDVERHPSGAISSLSAAGPSTLETPFGALIPQHTADSLRKRRLPRISFHENGMVRMLPLEEQTTIQTPAGEIPAELIGIHEDGSLNRIFPLNGALSGFWSQEDESELAAPVELDTPLGKITATIISAHFAPSGALLSLTLWPGQTLEVHTPNGPITARAGVSFYDDGRLRSLEPAKSTPVPTPLGELTAFDPDTIGISGDLNSLRFAPSGEVTGLVTTSHGFDVADETGAVERFSPPLRKSYCDGETPEIVPLKIVFDDGEVEVSAEGKPLFKAPLERVSAHRFSPPLPRFTPSCGALPMAG